MWLKSEYFPLVYGRLSHTDPGFGSVATGYGQPPSTIYDWALEPASLRDADYRLPDDLATRLRIEKFCDRVTKALYSSKPEPAEFISADKLVVVQVLESELRDMDVEFDGKISGKLLSYHSNFAPLTLAPSNQYDPSPSRRIALPILHVFGVHCTKRRSDQAFPCNNLLPWSSTRPRNVTR